MPLPRAIGRVARVSVAVAVAALLGCSRNSPTYAPDLWDDVAYDRTLTVRQLQDLGWECRRWVRPDAEGQDGQCGPRGDPRLDVFGVPAAASSIFLKGGSSHVVNIQLHATGVPFVAENLRRVFGAPEKSTSEDGSCVLLWDRGERSYMLYVKDEEDLARYATLFVAPTSGALGRLPPSSPWGALKAAALRMPCARF